MNVSIVLCYTSLMQYQLKTHNTIAYFCHYHVVFCPKYRHKVFVSPIDERLNENGVYLPIGASAKSGLTKSILDAGWASFLCILSA